MRKGWSWLREVEIEGLWLEVFSWIERKEIQKINTLILEVSKPGGALVLPTPSFFVFMHMLLSKKAL